MKNFCLLVLIMISVVLASCKADKELLPETLRTLESLTCITEDFPPFNYKEGGQYHGIAVDLLVEIWKDLGVNRSSESIVLMEWSEGYQKTLNEANTLLFSTSRIPEREDLFRWAGPITRINESIIALGGSSLSIQTGADLKQYTIGVISDYSNISLLHNLGITNEELTFVHNAEELYRKLDGGEVDVIAFSEASGQIVAQLMGYDPSRFTPVFTLKSSEIYYAFNRDTDPQVVEAFQTSIDRLKNEKSADGSSVYEKVLNRYHLVLQTEDPITDEMVTGLVNRTSADLNADQDATLQRINKAEAPYLDADNPSLYVFVYDTTVTMVTHATNPSLVGVSLRGKGDVTGKLFRDEIVAGALKNGSGWVDYIYTKPDQGGLYRKTTYYKRAKGNKGDCFVVCSGKYK